MKIEYKKLLFTSVVLSFLFITIASAANGEIYRDGESIVYDSDWGNLTITPENVTSRYFPIEQEFTACNEMGAGGYLFAGFDFNDTLISGNMYLWKNITVEDSRYVYGTVYTPYTCEYDFDYVWEGIGDPDNYFTCYYYNETSGNNTIVREGMFYNGSIPLKTVWQNGTGIIGTELYDRSYMGYSNVNSAFDVATKGDRKVYHSTSGLYLAPNSCRTFKLEYTPKYNQGKWDALFYAHTSNDWTCILDDSCFRTARIDPTWNKLNFNTTTNTIVNIRDSAVTSGEQLLYLKKFKQLSSADDIFSDCNAGYHLDESSGNATDFCGSNDVNAGIPSSYSINSPIGLNTSYEFDGTGNIQVPNDPTLQITDTLTISAWIKFDKNDIPSGAGVISKNGGGANGDYYIRCLGSGTCTFGLNDNAANGCTASGDYGDDNWHFLVATYDSGGGQNPRLYVDGVQACEGSYSTAIQVSSDNLNIGRYDPSLWWDGLIDEVYIFNRTLNSTEVSSLYYDNMCTRLLNASEDCSDIEVHNSTDTYEFIPIESHIGVYDSYIPDNACDLYPELDSWFKLDETSGTTTVDECGLNNATITGSPDLNTDSLWNFEGGYDLDGSADYTTTAITEDYKYTGNFSVCEWFNSDSFSGTRYHVQYYIVDWYGWIMYSDNGANIRFEVYGSPSVYEGRTYGALSINTWYFVCGVWRDNEPYLYVNGVEVGTETGTSIAAPAYTSNHRLRIGANPAASFKFDGTVDNVMLWNKALSIEEIRQFMNPDAIRVLDWSQSSNSSSINISATGIAQTPSNADSNTDLMVWLPMTSEGLYNESNNEITQGRNFNFDELATWRNNSCMGNSCWYFNGAGGYSGDGGTYANLPYASWMPTGNDAWSISVWIKPFYYAGGVYQTMLTYGEETPSSALKRVFYGFDGTNNDGTTSLELGAGNSVNSDYVFPLNEWTYVTITYDGSNATLWINGSYDVELIRTLNIPASNDGISLGGMYWNSGSKWIYDYTGLMSGFRMYNRSLSASEVADLYNEGTHTTPYFGSSITIPSNNAPVVNSVNITPTTAYTNNTLTCTVNSTDADADSITNYFNWFVDSSNVFDESGAINTSTLASGNFSKNQNIICEVTAYDGTVNSTAVNSSTLTISNTLPTASSVNITPTTAYTNDTLTGNYTFFDLDSDSDSSTLNWYKNGALLISSVQTLTSGNFSKNDNIIFEVVPNDGEGNGTAVNSSTLTISNAAPTGATNIFPNGSEVFTGAATNSISINWTNGNDIDNDVLIYSLFYSNDSGVNYYPIFSPENNAYALWDFESSLTVDSLGNAPVLSQESGGGTWVQNSSCIKGLGESDTGCVYFPNGGNFMKSEGGSNGWIPTQSTSISMWLNPEALASNMAAGGRQRDLSGTRGFLTIDVISNNFMCEMGKEDGGSTITVSSGVTATVGQWNHVSCVWDANGDLSGNLSIYVDGIYRGSSLYTCVGCTSSSNIKLGGGRTSTAQYWRGLIDDFTIHQVALTPDQVLGVYKNFSNPYTWDSSEVPSGSNYRVLVQTFDGTDYGVNESSDADFTITHNLAPSLNNINLTPDPLYTNFTANCSGVYSDPEGSNGTVYYSWFLNGAINETGIINNVLNNTLFNVTLDSSYYVKGDNVTCQLIAQDDTINTTAVNTSLLVSNSAPSGTITITSPILNQVLDVGDSSTHTITWTGVTDADGDTITYVVEYNYSNGGGDSLVRSTLASVVTDLTYSWDLSLLPTVDVVLWITATDGSSNSSTTELNGFVVQALRQGGVESGGGGGDVILTTALGDLAQQETLLVTDPCDVNIEVSELNLEDKEFLYEITPKTMTKDVKMELFSNFKNLRDDKLENKIVLRYPLLLDSDPKVKFIAEGCNETIIRTLEVDKTDHIYSILVSVGVLTLWIALMGFMAHSAISANVKLRKINKKRRGRF